MNILDGKIQKSTGWRVVVLLSATDVAPMAWRLANIMARSHQGELVATIILTQEQAKSAETIASARNLLQQVINEKRDADRVSTLLITASQTESVVQKLVGRTEADLLITADHWVEGVSLRNLPCSVGILHWQEGSLVDIHERDIDRILIPSAGGPHTAHALKLLSDLPKRIELETIYVCTHSQPQEEEERGKERLNEILTFSDTAERVKTKVARYNSAIEGISQYANHGTDLIVIGATNQALENSAQTNKFVYNIVRKTPTPVLVMHQSKQVGKQMMERVDWKLQSIFPRLGQKERKQRMEMIRENAYPDLDYYVLITLSSAIAGFGLASNSGAVVIGAMLVAPLMAPIIAMGMGVVQGDLRIWKESAVSAFRGIAIAIFVGLLIGLLPGIASSQSEVIARTNPTLLDLGIAVFSGLAGAFALVYKGAGGALPGVSIAVALVPPLVSVGINFAERKWAEGFRALLLFTTNLIAITLSAAFVFSLFGFRPKSTDKQRRKAQIRSLLMAGLSLAVIAVMLTLNQFRITREDKIRTVTTQQISEIWGDDAILTNLDATQGIDRLIQSDENDPNLELSIVLRSPNAPHLEEIKSLQEGIGLGLQQQGEMSIEQVKVNVVHIKSQGTFNPFTVPEPTATPFIEPTETSIPVPTATPQPTATEIAEIESTAIPAVPELSQTDVPAIQFIEPTDIPTEPISTDEPVPEIPIIEELLSIEDDLIVDVLIQEEIIQPPTEEIPAIDASTEDPIVEPTVVIPTTEAPIVEPTIVLPTTEAPTEAPAIEPTVEIPTITPTELPTVEPTIEVPTEQPTVVPTTEPVPTEDRSASTSPPKETARVQALWGLNLRSAASSSAPIVAALQDREWLILTGNNAIGVYGHSWVEVIADGEIGWVDTLYIRQ